MLDYAWPRLREAGYLPYYLYRQKYMSGALENIGWCKPGCEGLYNICIMEELHTILALGGGGSTKLTDPATGKIVRITNPKYPHVYLERVDQICANKAQLSPSTGPSAPGTLHPFPNGGDCPMAYQLKDINRMAAEHPEDFLARSDAQFNSKVRTAADRIAENLRRSPIVLLSGPSGSGQNHLRPEN